MREANEPYVILGKSDEAEWTDIVVQHRHLARQFHPDRFVDCDEPTRQRVVSGLAHQYGPDLVISYQTTPDLLGGLRIRVGNDVFDGSVKGRLDRLAAAF